jgi:ERCC4-type nuclease
VQGYPSRQSLIHYINIENIRANTTEYISNLFELIENEESPFVIAKKGKIALEAINKDAQFVQYKPFIEKTLSVRILQKCKSFYKTMKLSKLTQMLSFCVSITEVEVLL